MRGLPTGPRRRRERGAAGNGIRSIRLAVVATLLAVAGGLAPVQAPVALAAADGLQLSTAATYTIAPGAHVVRAVVDVTATNDKPNVTAGGIVTKYFYEGARIAVQPEATNVRATSGSASLRTTRTSADGYAVVEVRFGRSLFFHQTIKVRVTFDLPGGKPRSQSDIRIGKAFATFVAWGFGDRASVRVVVPAGFEAATRGSPVTSTTNASGATVFEATGIADIPGWYLVVNADRQSALTTDRIDLVGGEHLVVRAWPEDRVWKERVTTLLRRGLPALVDATGLDWPVAADLTVFEVHTPLLEGYAGVFHPAEERIEVSEDLDDLTILHEASHAWFNDALFTGRWIDEGLADAYAATALDSIGIGGWAPSRVDPTDRASIELNAWESPGRIADAETEAREDYGYNAAWTVIRSLLAEIGVDGMRRVLAAADARRIAYVGAGPAETIAVAADWRRFLDLLDELGGSRGADDLFRRWVVTDADRELMAKRDAARMAYRELATAGWGAPLVVRRPLSEWSFDDATARIEEARALLAKRDAIRREAAKLDLAPPPALESAYEAADGSFDAANRIADQELEALRQLAVADTAVTSPRAPFVNLGLIGTAPEADLAAARSAFASGAADAATRAAAVTALIDGSVPIGRQRFVAAIVTIVILVAIGVIAGLVLVRRRRSLAAVAVGAVPGAPGSEALIAAAPPTVPADADRAAAAEPVAVADRPAAADPIAVADSPAPAAPAATAEDRPVEPPATSPPYATLAARSGDPGNGEPVDGGQPAPEPKRRRRRTGRTRRPATDDTGDAS